MAPASSLPAPRPARTIDLDAGHGERRRRVLAAAEVLGRPLEELDGFTTLARLVTGAPQAVIHVVDGLVLRPVSTAGGALTDLPIEESLCRYTLGAGEFLHVADASQDARFGTNPHVDGRKGSVRMYAGAPLRGPGGVPVGTLCVLSDAPGALDEQRQEGLRLLGEQLSALLEARDQGRQLAQALRELDRLMHLDPLTGLGNRTVAASRLAEICRSGGGAVLFIDMDDLKAVNDLAGHHAGDAALQEVVRRLARALRPEDVLTRWAGDEFVALVGGVDTPTALDALVARVAAAVAGSCEVAGLDLLLSASVGGCVVSAGDVPEEALRRADVAMYEVKQRRQGRRGRCAGTARSRSAAGAGGPPGRRSARRISGRGQAPAPIRPASRASLMPRCSDTRCMPSRSSTPVMSSMRSSR